MTGWGRVRRVRPYQQDLAREDQPMHRPTADCTIRHARLQDVDALRRLAYAAARVLCAPDYTPTQVDTMLRFGLGPDAQIIADGTYYVVEDPDGRIAAAGGWSYRAALMGTLHPDYYGGPRDVVDPAAHPARLRAVFVRPAHATRPPAPVPGVLRPPRRRPPRLGPGPADAVRDGRRRGRVHAGRTAGHP